MIKFVKFFIKMDDYTKCIERHKSIIALIADKTPLCVQNMIDTLQNYQNIKRLDEEMIYYYDIYLRYHCCKNSLEICHFVYEKLTNYQNNFQGGSGHLIHSNLKLPDRWCVKPEFYEDVKLNVYEKMALKANYIDVEIDENVSNIFTI